MMLKVEKSSPVLIDTLLPNLWTQDVSLMDAMTSQGHLIITGCP